MIRVKIKSDRTKTVSYLTRKLEVGKFIVTEFYTNGKLTGQEWSVIGGFKKTHPDAYEAKSLYFGYYEDISFLDSEECSKIEIMVI